MVLFDSERVQGDIKLFTNIVHVYPPDAEEGDDSPEKFVQMHIGSITKVKWTTDQGEYDVYVEYVAFNVWQRSQPNAPFPYECRLDLTDNEEPN